MSKLTSLEKYNSLERRCNELEMEVATLQTRLQTGPHFQVSQTAQTPTISENPQETSVSGSSSKSQRTQLQTILSEHNTILADFVLADGTDPTIVCKQTLRIMAEPRSSSNIERHETSQERRTMVVLGRNRKEWD